ncbi:MAG: hypothetical protein ABGX27_08450, partial [Desulfurobacteriaceae bacterium]
IYNLSPTKRSAPSPEDVWVFSGFWLILWGYFFIRGWKSKKLPRKWLLLGIVVGVVIELIVTIP